MENIKVVIIDSDDRAFKILNESFYGDYILELFTLENYFEMLKKFKPHIILVRTDMLKDDGFAICQMLKKHVTIKHIPIMMFSRIRVDAERALEVGAVDYFTTTEPTAQIFNRINAHRLSYNLKSTCKKYVVDIKGQYTKNIKAMFKLLGRLAEYKDYFDDDHIFRVGKYTYTLALEVGYSEEEAERLRIASFLHDIGKVVLREDLLLKKGAYTLKEWHEMTEHTQVVDGMIQEEFDLLNQAAAIAKQHHEKYNGEGYPDQLSGDEIVMDAKIVSLCEVFDALTHNRHHREAWDYAKVIDYIRLESGKSFDPVVVDAFLNHLDKFINIKHNTF